MSYLLSKRTVELAVPVASVFAFAANLENFPTWFPGALSIQARDTKEVDEVGKSYSEIVILPFGRKTKVNIQVMEAQKPIRLATEGNYRLLLPRMEMDFIAIDENRTKMQW
ncbi:MAG TPA: SRPBCC family protein [Pseudomonas xinjiangensis]|uniref:SRPBCC family protein n=2 Tax=root TaxID=1 RepID=A0A7V1BSM2_9GAMM|nr:SRPBCC family protein [Halopseudomonas xinjiangensis]HEC46334.1 SRPBCC family protein [Halopseudomonas xinjiangensis]